MSESFLPYGQQTITEADIAAVETVLRSSFLTQGSVVPAFEQAFAAKVSASHGVAVNSATSALHIACLALGLGPGDFLWTSPITFVASANCGRYCGAEVDFVDIDPATGLMSVPALEQKLVQAERNGALPKVVVPVHLTGSSCDMAAIGSLAERYGFSVLEDASHAVGGRYKGEPVGNCRHSAITVFGLPVKIITLVKEVWLLLTMLNWPRVWRSVATALCAMSSTLSNQLRVWLRAQQLGFNYRITDIQSSPGLSQLNGLMQSWLSATNSYVCRRSLPFLFNFSTFPMMYLAQSIWLSSAWCRVLLNYIDLTLSVCDLHRLVCSCTTVRSIYSPIIELWASWKVNFQKLRLMRGVPSAFRYSQG